MASRWLRGALAPASFAVLLLPVLATTASAHLEFFPGRLLDLVQRSDRLLIAKVTQVDDATPVAQSLTVEWRASDGATISAPMRAHRRLGFAAGRTYAFFVTTDAESFECVQPAGVLFPVDGEGREFEELDKALRPLLGGPTEPITAALIPALQSASPELRYNVAFALRDAAHGEHPLPPAQFAQLQQIMADPSFDDTMRPLLAPLVMAARTPGTP